MFDALTILSFFIAKESIMSLIISNEDFVISIEFQKGILVSCKSLVYPDGNDLRIVITLVKFPITIAVFDLINSSGSGFFFCGMALELDACLSLISTNENSCDDQIMMSCAILLCVIIIDVISDINSIMKSLDEVASIVFDIIFLNPSNSAVLFLLRGRVDPPIGPEPNGDSLTLSYNEINLLRSRNRAEQYDNR